MKSATKARIARATALALALLLATGSMAYRHLESRASRFDPDPMQKDSAAKAVGIEVDWAYWTSINPDIAAWLAIPGTDISLPVVRAPESDPDYYLSHDAYREPNPMGAVYLDPSCPGFSEPGNSVILGHNWAGAVLGPLANYGDRDWALDHREILLLLPDEEPRRLQVQSADVIPGWSPVKRTRFEHDSDLRAYWEERFDACDTKLASAPADADHLYTFATCSYNFNPSNERTLVYAVEVDDE